MIYNPVVSFDLRCQSGIFNLILGPYLVIISFSSSLSNYYNTGGRALPLGHYSIYTLIYRPCPDRLSFLAQIYTDWFLAAIMLYQLNHSGISVDC